ncbi:hypothetical protein VI26_18205 [Chromobacterium sp. LK1]|uniref:hypothetical protein n=1 Tax=Chromobacterium sp. LK1 TaxID=1628193 RepID=UPI00065393AF|nr:hypothetical protein [Chromobacterium sp. LK1]KMN32099.1 hypothetical protein VI26_18205 [Chromobacterium sp. LK1]
MPPEEILERAAAAFDHLGRSKTLTLGQGARIVASFRGVEPLSGDLFPADARQLELATWMLMLICETDRLLERYRGLGLPGQLKMAEVPLLQNAVKERYHEVIGGKPAKPY